VPPTAPTNALHGLPPAFVRSITALTLIEQEVVDLKGMITSSLTMREAALTMQEAALAAIQRAEMHLTGEYGHEEQQQHHGATTDFCNRSTKAFTMKPCGRKDPATGAWVAIPEMIGRICNKYHEATGPWGQGFTQECECSYDGYCEPCHPNKKNFLDDKQGRCTRKKKSCFI